MSPAAAEAHAQMVPILAARLQGNKGLEAACWEQGQGNLKAKGQKEQEEREDCLGNWGEGGHGSRLRKTEAGEGGQGRRGARGSRRGQRGEEPALGPAPHTFTGG